MTPVTHWLNVAKSIFDESFQAFYALLKIMVPALIVVKVLETLGAIEVIAAVLSPVMSLLGLPDLLGVVWATALLTNIYAALLVFFGMANDLALTVEHVTILGTLILIGHGIPVEGAVAKRAGVPWLMTIALRVGGALLLGAILHAVYSHIPSFQQPAQFLWQPQPVDDSLSGWLISQVQSLVMVFVIIFVLVALLKLLRHLGVERWIHFALAPFLKMMGIGRAAANVTGIGFTLGLSYGAGLIIKDLDKGVMSRKDACLTICFLGLAHSVVEDTLLIMAMGADLSGILWARLVFSFVVIALLARVTFIWGEPQKC